MLTVECLETCRLVSKVEEMPAMLRQKTDMEPPVLKSKILVRLIHLAVEENVLHRIRIDPPLRPLIYAACVEKRRFVIPSRRICRKND